MAATEALPAPPMMAEAAPQMSTTEAMDVLDEFHIKRGDMQRVCDACEVLMGPGEEAGDIAPEGDEQQMAAEMFAPGRDRKAM